MEDTKNRFDKTTAEVLADWDAGETIWSVEMGGLGPGYEQAIQCLIMEFVRANKSFEFSEDEETDWKQFDKICTARLKRVDESLRGITGAQYGAAAGVAWRFLKYGYAEMMNKAPKDRLIQVSNTWVAA